MANLNKVFLIGRLTRNPELRHTPSGTAIASFGIAVNRYWKGQSGEKKKEECFVTINMFGKRAEVINEYFSKGNPIFIEGRLRFQRWETKDGQKRNTLRVVAEDFQFLGKTRKGEGTDIPEDEIDVDEDSSFLRDYDYEESAEIETERLKDDAYFEEQEMVDEIADYADSLARSHTDGWFYDDFP
jgi:single-strand DNA-binding protein